MGKGKGAVRRWVWEKECLSGMRPISLWDNNNRYLFCLIEESLA